MIRRIAIPALLLAAIVVPALAAQATAVDAVSLVVSDLDRAVAFYRDVLTFEKVSEIEVYGEDVERLYGVFGARARIARLRLGDEAIELTEFLAPRGRPFPRDQRSNDLSFQHVAIIVSDMTAAYARLRENRVEHASTGPQRLPDWNPAAGGIEAFYFRDPDGHPLEILAFPEGKGAAKWHQKGGPLFLGIDHTAIVVDHTEPSLRFWRDGLGLKVAGESENHGTEQEHLNNVFGARLRISGLRAPGGFGVEFLDYLAPGDGRAASLDARTNDLASTTTVLTVPDAEAAARDLVEAGFEWVSPGVVTVRPVLGYVRGATVRDPDGHFVRLIEKQGETRP
jgi:catechol 2,3-dioxygenase-like lactoylglutathione lyase family enzyme